MIFFALAALNVNCAMRSLATQNIAFYCAQPVAT